MSLLCCNPLTGNLLPIACGQKRGGLFGEIYAANFCDIASITSSTSSKEYDGIVMEIDPLTTDPAIWYRIVFKKNTAGLSNELQIGNNTFTNQSISFTVEGLTAAALQTLQDLSTGEAVFIAKDFLGVTHLLGRVAGLTVSAMTVGTGVAADDIYGSVITFLGGEPEFSNTIATGTQITVLSEDGVTTETVTL